MPAGLAVIFAFGLIWLASFVPTERVLELGLTPFLLGGILKVVLAGILTFMAPPRLKHWIRS